MSDEPDRQLTPEEWQAMPQEKIDAFREQMRALYDREPTAVRVVEMTPAEGWVQGAPIVREEKGEADPHA